MKAADKDLNQQLREARRQHKERAEQELANSNIKKLWDSIRKMTNTEPTRNGAHEDTEPTRMEPTGNGAHEDKEPTRKPMTNEGK